MDYQVRLDSFEGPLDLLLHLIKKNEVDIWDIPIALITEQYLEYLGMMGQLNLDLAGEFLLMASTLMQIKSRMLLPPSEEEEGEEEEIDPRDELVRRLLEYKKYKEASKQLEGMDMVGREVFLLGLPEDIDDSADVEETYREVSLFDLIEALQDVLREASRYKAHDVTRETVSIEEKMEMILQSVKNQGHITFHSLFNEGVSKSDIVAIFLALLELMKMKSIQVFQGEIFGVIMIKSAGTVH